MLRAVAAFFRCLEALRDVVEVDHRVAVVAQVDCVYPQSAYVVCATSGTTLCFLLTRMAGALVSAALAVALVCSRIERCD